MPLDQIANIAEIVGLMLVVVTLIILVLQIRQNTRALRSSTIQAVLQSEVDFVSVIIDNTATWEKIITGGSFAGDEETRKAIILYNLFMIDTESRYHQYQTGFLHAQPWGGRLSTLPAIVRLPIFNMWRSSFGAQSHSADFLSLLDNIATQSTDGHGDG